jgi:hypothetical protein
MRRPFRFIVAVFAGFAAVVITIPAASASSPYLAYTTSFTLCAGANQGQPWNCQIHYLGSGP